MWYPASRSVKGDQEQQLRRVHTTPPPGARKLREFNQGGPFVVRSCSGPGIPFPDMVAPVLATPTQEARLSHFRWHQSQRSSLMGPRRRIIESKRNTNNLLSLPSV